MSPSQDLVFARQDLDRAKSTPYHVIYPLLARLQYVHLGYSRPSVVRACMKGYRLRSGLCTLLSGMHGVTGGDGH